LERQAQLLALTDRSETKAPSRRFLETLGAGSRPRQGGGWTWSRTPEGVSWGPVAPQSWKEYFIQVEAGPVYDLGAYHFRWTLEPQGALWLPGIDPGHPWVWRSVVAGMRISSAGESDWGRDLRRKRLGAVGPTDVALAVQHGLVRAAVDPIGKKLLWSDSGDEKLHKPGIFVTLVTVTPFLTE
jgi:hypothetical protein